LLFEVAFLFNLWKAPGETLSLLVERCFSQLACRASCFTWQQVANGGFSLLQNSEMILVLKERFWLMTILH